MRSMAGHASIASRECDGIRRNDYCVREHRAAHGVLEMGAYWMAGVEGEMYLIPTTLVTRDGHQHTGCMAHLTQDALRLFRASKALSRTARLMWYGK